MGELCDECDGTGKEYDGKKCPYCDGTGEK